MTHPSAPAVLNTFAGAARECFKTPPAERALASAQAPSGPHANQLGAWATVPRLRMLGQMPGHEHWLHNQVAQYHASVCSSPHRHQTPKTHLSKKHRKSLRRAFDLYAPCHRLWYSPQQGAATHLLPACASFNGRPWSGLQTSSGTQVAPQQNCRTLAIEPSEAAPMITYIPTS